MPTGFVPCLTGLSDGARRMKVRLNENEEIVRTVKEGLKAKGGYAPAVWEKRGHKMPLS